jgi:6-phosphogluconolactonase
LPGGKIAPVERYDLTYRFNKQKEISMKQKTVRHGILLLVAFCLTLCVTLAGCNLGDAAASAEDAAGRAVAVPRYLYALNQDNNTVSMFKVSSTKGTLTGNGTLDDGRLSSPTCIAANTVSGGTFAYIVNNGGNSIGVYKVSVSNPGVLVWKSTVSDTIDRPTWICFMPGGEKKGKFAYVTAYHSSSAVEIYEVNGTNGSLGFKRTQGFPWEVTALAFSAYGTNAFLAANDGTDFYIVGCSINVNGTLSIITTINVGKVFHYLYVTPNAVYGTGPNLMKVWSRSGANLTFLQDVPFGSEINPEDAVIDPLGRFLFLDVHYYDGSVWAFEIQSNGSLKQLSPSGGGLPSFPMGVTAEPTGKYVYMTSSDQNRVGAFSIDRTGVPGRLIKLQEVTIGTKPCSIAMAP